MAKKSSAKKSAAKKPARKDGAAKGAAAKPRKPKTKPDAPGAAAVQASGGAPGPGHNSDKRSADEVREGFLQHRKSWLGWQAKLKVVEKFGKDVKAALKADGYKVIEMQIADDLAGSPKSEAKIQMQVEDRLRVAQWIGHPMGSQMDLFAQPDRTPLSDRAYDKGKQASMENQAARPDYAPETEAYREYMRGYHDHQATIGKGFKKKPDAAAASAEKESAKEPEPASGEFVKRSEFSNRLRTMTATDGNGSPPDVKPH